MELSSLESELLNCEAKNTTSLEVIYQKYGSSRYFLDQMIELCRSGHLDVQASWLIKYRLSQNSVVSYQESTRILSLVKNLTKWQSILHVLQSVRYLQIGDNERHAHFEEILPLTNHQRAFVRAWAYDALHMLAGQSDDLRTRVKILLNSVTINEAPSVKARIRNILNSK